MSDLCFYFGVWCRSGAGHSLWAPGWRSAFRTERDAGRDSRRIEYHSGGRHLDGTLAPMRLDRTGELCWGAQFPRDEFIRAKEYPQGQYLLHHLDNGFTAIQWWDRCQGDKRGACNSTVLLEGQRAAQELEKALDDYFPEVLANLTAAGIELAEIGWKDRRQHG